MGVDVADVAASIRQGSRRHMARAITWCESKKPAHHELSRELLALLGEPERPANRVGLSGVPGAGKSTFTDALGCRLIQAGHRVAVLAIDPSSTRSGGSVLGDRTRMANLAASDKAYIRPSPTSGHLGGVARATREAMRIVEAAGFDVVFVETVGVGQSEVAVADMVDTFVLLALARAGDQLQGIKRGILELAEVVAINKADGPHEMDAKKAAVQLQGALRMLRGGDAPAVKTCSAQTGAGLDALWELISGRHGELVATGGLARRRAEQQRSWMWSQVENEVLAALHRDERVARELSVVEPQVLSGKMAPSVAAERLRCAFLD